MKNKNLFMALICALFVLTSCGYERIDAGHEGMKVNLYGSSKREEFEKAIEDRLAKELNAECFQLEQMTSGLQYPNSLVKAIDAKNAAVQEAQRAANEVLKIEAEARKKVAQAQGEADALRIKGDAESEYNRKISASLSDLIIQQEMIKKWDGKTPVFMGASNTMLDASKFVK